MSVDFLEQNLPNIQNLDNETKFCRPSCWGPSIHLLGRLSRATIIHIKCHPPLQPTACHCRHNSPPLTGHHFLHCLCCPSLPQLLPFTFTYPFLPQPYALEVFNRVQEGLVIASRQPRRGGGGLLPGIAVYHDCAPAREH